MKFQTLLLIVLTIAFLGVMAYGANFVINQNRQLAQNAAVEPTPSTTPEQEAFVEEEAEERVEELAMDVAEKTQAVVVFEAAGSFTQLEKDQLTQRIAEPYVAYYQDLYALEESAESNKLLTFTIEKNSIPETAAEFPYLAQAIFDNGANQGFVVSVTGGDGTVAGGGTVNWWFPECMIECYFSDQFQTDYPEIVDLAS